MMKRATLPKMNIVIVGHVDHGKSTLIGRLLADTGSLPQGKLEQVQNECRLNAKPFEYAFLLDALKDEQAQGITIDAARCFFRGKKRDYIIIDAPGHIEFLKNMVSGAARAEAALLVIDAKEGIQENSKRHGYLLSMLGIRQIAVCVNKMDLVGYEQHNFDQIEKSFRSFLHRVGVKAQRFIPVAAREGDLITGPSERMRWYRGPSVLEVLDSFEQPPDLQDKPLRMPVQSVYKFTEWGDDRRIVAGRIESGTLAVGDEVIFLPSNKRSRIQSIEIFNAPGVKRVTAGTSAAVTLEEQIYVNRGEVMCKWGEPLPRVGPLIRTQLFWMGKQPMVPDQEYLLKLGTAKVPVRLREIRKVIDASDLKRSQKKRIERYDVADCVLECRSTIPFDLSHTIEATGRFVVVDRYDVAGGGIIASQVQDEQADVRRQVSVREQNWDASVISSKEREVVYGHRPKLILLTGRIGVNKRSLAKHLEKALFEMGGKVYFLGMGNLLRGLDADLEEDRRSRREHVRRMGEVAHLLMDAGLVVVATASDIDDEELKLLQEVTSRDSICILHVGPNPLRHHIVDLHLDPKESIEKNVIRCLDFLNDQGILAPKSESFNAKNQWKKSGKFGFGFEI